MDGWMNCKPSRATVKEGFMHVSCKSALNQNDDFTPQKIIASSLSVPMLILHFSLDLGCFKTLDLMSFIYNSCLCYNI